MADLTGSSPADDLCDVPVRCDLARRNLLDDGENEFGVVVIHELTSLQCPAHP